MRINGIFLFTLVCISLFSSCNGLYTSTLANAPIFKKSEILKLEGSAGSNGIGINASIKLNNGAYALGGCSFLGKNIDCLVLK